MRYVQNVIYPFYIITIKKAYIEDLITYFWI